jgi:tryptophan-rich sensory protein
MKRGTVILALVISIGLSLSVGFVGGLATASSVDSWYQSLDKPSWTPPDMLFGPVWTVLYILMGIAAWLVWKRAGDRMIHRPLAFYALQLLLNACWSFIFFGLRNPGAALIEIFFLWAAIVITITLFARVDRKAAWLLAPYLAWVSFAVALNFAIWRLN